MSLILFDIYVYIYSYANTNIYILKSWIKQKYKLYK